MKLHFIKGVDIMLGDCNNSPSVDGKKDLRCDCGQLMAVQTDQGIEIKCRRCKHITLIPTKDIQINGKKI